MTIGPLCVAHDVVVRTAFVRGRPFWTAVATAQDPPVRLELAPARL
jgi:hypothetical protein